MVKVSELPIARWCEDNNIKCYSVACRPEWDADKNRVSKGKLMTPEHKGIIGWDKSLINNQHNGLMFQCGSTDNGFGGSGLVCLDFDVHGDEEPEMLWTELLEQLTADCGFIVRTGSGGLHLYWRLPEGMNWNKQLKANSLLGHSTAVDASGAVMDVDAETALLAGAFGRLDILCSGTGVILPGTSYDFKGQRYFYEPVKGETPDDATLLPAYLVEEFNRRPDMVDKRKRGKVTHGTLSAALDAVVDLAAPPQPPNPPRSRSASPLRSADVDLAVLAGLLDCLSGDWLANYDNWRNLCFAVRSVAGDKSAAREMLVKTARRSPRHNTEEHSEATRNCWANAKPDGPIGFGSLYYWAKSCNPDKFHKVFKDNYEVLLLHDGRPGHGNVFITELAGSCVYSAADKAFWIWLEHKSLWALVNEDYITSLFMTMMPRVVDKIRSALPKPQGDDEENPNAKKHKALLKLRQEFANGLHANTLTYLRANLNPAISPRNLDAFVVDKNPDLLPLANGVWNFREGRLEKYARTHYLSKRLDLCYDADADTKDIKEAMRLWFKGDKETIDWLQYWLGYLITGHTSRQEFIIVYGKSAGNGKSTLFSDILQKDILTTLYATAFGDDAFSRTGGNNDDIYYSIGKRLAIISEAGSTHSQAKELNAEMLKRFTGEDVVAVEAKYKGKVEATMTAKAAMLCNHLPKLPAGENGVARRLLTIEMNVKFLRPSEYEELTEAEKASKDYGVRDPDFIQRLRANRAGTLKWLLEGAQRFMANPNASAPAKLQRFTAECMALSDPNWKWFTENYTFNRASKEQAEFKPIADAWCDYTGIKHTNGTARSNLLKSLKAQMGERFVQGNSKSGYVLVGVTEQTAIV